MHQTESVILVPGQGILRQAMFRTGGLHRHYLRVLNEAGVSGSGSESVEGFVLTASVAHYRDQVTRNPRPATIVGHGFGELVALVCAGAFTVRQGVEIALQRAAVLDEYQSEAGSMLSVTTTSATAERLVQLAGASRTAIAAENAPTAIVISGTRSGIASVRHRAHREGIAAAPLKARWALHCPQIMLPAAVELTKRLQGIPARLPRVPVFSPTLGRYYRPSDDLAACLAQQLTLRVRFAGAIRALIAEGACRFVECGPLSGLGRSVAEIRAAFPGDEAGYRDPLLPAGWNDDAAGAGACDEEPALTVALAG